MLSYQWNASKPEMNQAQNKPQYRCCCRGKQNCNQDIGSFHNFSFLYIEGDSLELRLSIVVFNDFYIKFMVLRENAFSPSKVRP